MYTRRNIRWNIVLRFAWKNLIFFALWAALVTYYNHHLEHHGTSLAIPFLPLSTIGIAVAFYIGFKNNSAYDRTWEARKIWGGIVNSSRSWGTMVNGFVTNEFATDKVSDEELYAIRKRLIYRHIAWTYRLKRQLRAIKSWEHDARFNRRYRSYIEELFPTEDPEAELKNFLADDEVKYILSKKNGCTQLIHKQTEDLRELKAMGLIDDFRHMEMQGMLTEFYTLQGKCERIKNFPLPRQYASLSIYFVYIFIFLMPLGLLSAFADAELPDYMVWGVIPFTALIGWVFLLYEFY